MSNLNLETGKYPDLVHTNFPADVDVLDDKVDVSATTFPYVVEYNNLCEQGKFGQARALLTEHPELKDIIINAETINKYQDGLMAVQRMFKDDIEGYVKSFVWSEDISIGTYEHTKSGSIHRFTGKGPNGKVNIKYNFSVGDSIVVSDNGSSYTVSKVYMGIDEISMNDLGDITGRWMSFIFDKNSKTLNFNGGGGLTNGKLQQATATADDAVFGATFYAGDKTLKYGTIPLASTDVVEANVLSGNKYVGVDRKLHTGNMPNNGTVSVNPLAAGGSYTIPKGFHSGSAVIRAKDLASQTGNWAANGATAADIRSGKWAYVNGSYVAGTNGAKRVLVGMTGAGGIGSGSWEKNVEYYNDKWLDRYYKTINVRDYYPDWPYANINSFTLSSNGIGWRAGGEHYNSLYVFLHSYDASNGNLTIKYLGDDIWNGDDIYGDWCAIYAYAY